MATAFTEKQLGQLRTTSTSAEEVYGPSSARGIITQIHLANQHTGSVAFEVYHDDDGTTYDATTRLTYGTLGASKSEILDVFIPVADGGSFAVKADTANVLNVTVYGAEIT